MDSFVELDELDVPQACIGPLPETEVLVDAWWIDEHRGIVEGKVYGAYYAQAERLDWDAPIACYRYNEDGFIHASAYRRTNVHLGKPTDDDYRAFEEKQESDLYERALKRATQLREELDGCNRRIARHQRWLKLRDEEKGGEG